MTLPTHAVAGALIGCITGQPLVGILVACLPDIDHLYSYIKHGYLKNWPIFYKNAFGKEDIQGDQRNILHNIIIAFGLSLIVFFLFHSIFLTFLLSYASHLLLDAIDTSDYFPLYPYKIINIRGFIDFYSWQEVLLNLLLLLGIAILKI